tara:strand:- start:2577 stop:2957 length:381 start_codon:yes stop_codon:yes gene_type:complete
MNHKHIFAVFFGGAVGALARWGLLEVLPTVTQWPWHVLIINISGSAALGIMVGLFTKDQNDLLFLAAGGGFCGAFTTFSSFSVEIAAKLKTQEYFDAVSFLTSSVLGGLVAYQIGKFVIRQTKAHS